jgi:hypothetical protein
MFGVIVFIYALVFYMDTNGDGPSIVLRSSAPGESIQEGTAGGSM